MDKKKILIVDDEVAFTRTLKLNLERTGLYEVRAENKGRLVSAAAKEFKPDLILLDVLMPDYDGGAVASRLKSDPALKDIPIIFLTATVSTREAGSRGTQRGGFFFLAKPVSIEHLIECIEQHTAPLKNEEQPPPPDA